MSRRLSLCMFLHVSWWACVRLVRRCGFVFANVFLDACRTIDFFVQRHACFRHCTSCCLRAQAIWLGFFLHRGCLLTQMMHTLTSFTSGVHGSTIPVRSVMLGSLVAGGGEFSWCHQISMTCIGRISVISTCTCVTSFTWIQMYGSSQHSRGLRH